MIGSLADRFHAKVRTAENGCHEWQGCLARNGYGQIGLGKRVLYAHRVAWTLAHGDPGDSYVLHRCDNRRCVNPDHLFLGSFQDNMDDMVAKRRQACGRRKPNAKLTNSLARYIAASPETHAELARLFDVSIVTIWQVRNGKTWKQALSEKI